MRLTVMIPMGVLGAVSASALAAQVWQLPIGLDDSSTTPGSFHQFVGSVAGESLSVGARVTPLPAGGADHAGTYQIIAAAGAFSGGTGSASSQEFDSAPLTLALGGIPAPMPSHGPGGVGSHDASPSGSDTSDTNWHIIGPLHPGLGKTIGTDEVGTPRLIEVNPVPLPTPMMLAGFGLMAMAGVRASARRRA